MLSTVKAKEVVDKRTGLMWQDEPKIVSLTQPKAVNYCEGLTLYGHKDWRLPTIDELKSIVDYSRPKDEVAIKTEFKHTQSSGYLTSSKVVDSSSFWVVYFANGTDFWTTDSASYYVRCVRQ